MRAFKVRKRTSIKGTIPWIITALDACTSIGWFDEFNIMFISTPHQTYQRRKHSGTMQAYPKHLLPAGLPCPPAPPLESYCPPPSLGLRRLRSSGRIHPVTDIQRHQSQGNRGIDRISHWAYLCPVGPLPVLKLTLLQNWAGSCPCCGEYLPAGEQYVFIPPGCSLSPILV